MSKETKDIYFKGVIYTECRDGNTKFYVDSTSPSYPVQGNHSFKDGQEVVEGKDYELQKQGQLTGRDKWYPLWEDVHGCYITRIVALPLTPTTDAQREEAKRLIELFKKEIEFNCQPSLSDMIAKQCAIICVDEILKTYGLGSVKYYQQVRTCIDKM